VTITAGKTTELDLEITGAGELKTR
jgi:hypothetical protein